MSQARKTQIETVADRIKKNGSLYGNKSANLMELDEISKHVNNKAIRVQVPEIFPLSDEFIRSHLDKYAVSGWFSGYDWSALWQEFVTLQGTNTVLTEDAKSKLQLLRDTITTIFSRYPIEGVIEQIQLPPDTLFMVRSTGEEDTVEVANPGGNKSVAAVGLDRVSMSRAIGVVVASYLSEKSLTQRLLSGDDISKPSFMPVLIQRMIGEKLNQNNRNDIVISGVMYANRDHVSLDVAPGFGELIVNSKGAFDTYEMNTATGIVHAQIHQKDERMVPVETEELNEIGSKKRKLIFKDNPNDVKTQPSLTQIDAKAIMELGKEIADHYEMPMDIEFAYDPQQKTLCLLQARPIPQNKKVKNVPSAIAPDQWLELLKDDSVKRLKCDVASKGHNAAIVISHNNEVIAEKEVGDALKRYLKDSSQQNTVRAVVVQNEAPASSHEVAFFHSQGIPVLHVADQLSAFEEMIKAGVDIAVVIDPQRQVILDMSRKVNNHHDAEQELKKRKIIVNGLYFSSASSDATMMVFDYEISAAVKTLLTMYLSCNDQVNIKNAYTQLLQCIEQIETVTAGDKNEAAFAALRKAAVLFKKLGTSQRAKNKSTPHAALFQRAMLSIAEIHFFLEDYSKQVLDQDTNITKLQYVLDAAAKLKGLVMSPGKAGLFSDSIRQIAENNKATQGVSTQAAGKNLEYLREFLKFSNHAFKKNIRSDWGVFATSCSSSPYTRNLLASIIAMAVKYHIESELIN